MLRRNLCLGFLLSSAVACSDDGSMAQDGGCTPVNCAPMGLQCGPTTGPNGECLFCGNCPEGLLCGGGGVPNQCGCSPKTCEQLGKNCGDVDDGCGTTIQCGQCEAPLSCGGGLEDNVCGITLGVGDHCEDHPEGCENAQLLCCPFENKPSICTRPTPGLERVCPEQLPDIAVDRSAVETSIMISEETFEATDCAIGEGCIDGPGDKRLLRFGTQSNNVGEVDLVLGVAGEDPEFIYSECHMHYHYKGYAQFRLLDMAGNELKTSGKVAFCIEDTVQWNPIAPPKKFMCGTGLVAGIQVGWADLYTNDLTCQWIDITDVPAGTYLLETNINPERTIDESDYDNNVLTSTVTIPPR